jgi:hypothetical protein
MGVELSRTANTQQKSSRHGSRRSAQIGVKQSSYSSRVEAEVWDGEPTLKSITEASAAGPYVSSNEKDIVKESYVSWESTAA